MSRRAAAVSLSRSSALFASLRSHRCFPPTLHATSCSNPHKRSRLYSFSSSGSSGSSSSSSSPQENDLQGLIDPESSFPCNGSTQDRGNHGKCTISAQDFTFLQEAAVDEAALKSCKFSDDAALISKSIGSDGSNFSDETLQFLRQFRGKLNERMVVEVLRLVKDPELGVKFFIWAGRQIRFSHTGNTYSTLLEILGCDKKSRVPDRFFREIGEDDRQVLERLLNVLIRRCCRNGLWNEALEELGRLKDFGYKPSKVTYNALVQVFLSADRLDSAFLVHREMMDSGISMDRPTIESFTHSLCKAGRWVEALSIVETEDYNLDTILGNQMISGLLEASLFEEAMSFLHRIRANSCVPNAATYRILLSGFLKKQQLGWCKRIVKMMITEGFSTSPSLFNSLVHAYCRSGDYSYAYKLLKKMDSCGCPPDYVTYNIFIGGVCENKELLSSDMLDLAEKAYGEMIDAGIVLNNINIANLARCLCGAEKFDKAFEIINVMMSKGFVPENKTYRNVIDSLCRSHKVEKAFLLFEEMKKNGVSPDVYTYTILIDSFCKVGLIQQARNWFNEMIRDGCAPNVVTYTALIHAYLKAKSLSEANELFNCMVSMDCLPNVVTYTALIDGLCKAGEIDKACQIYSKMRGTCEEGTDDGTYFAGVSSNITEPDVFTYGALVDGLCKAYKVVEARDLLGAMSSAGCEPNQVVYGALIDGYCKAGKLEEAQDIFVRMSERGYIPSVYTYSSLIDRLFKDRRLDLALKVLSKMLENSCVPNVITYTEMIDGLCKLGKTKEAYKLLSVMEEKGCKPNVVTYTAMIDGFGRAAEVDMCLEIFGQMTSKGCAPNFITYRVLISHCCAAGLLDEAYKLLEEMKQTYWPRHTTGYHDVILGFSKKFIISLGLLEEISKYSSVPLAPAYSILIDSLSKAGKLEMALELHKQIMSTSSCSAFVSRSMYSSLIQGLSLASKIEKALELYSEMTRRGHVPDLFILVCLIKGLLRVNKWDEALQLTYSVYHMGIDWHGEDGFGGS